MILMRDKNSNSKIMRNLLIALCPIIIFSLYKNGISPYLHNKVNLFGLFYPLLFILVPTIVTFLVELFYARIILHKKDKELKKYIKSSYSIFPGLFLGLICPINLPISILIIGAIVASILGKLVYGGFGNNIFNPALIGYIFIIACYPLYFSSDSYFNKLELDTISSATPLTNIKTLDNIGSYEQIIEPYGTMNDFFLGFIPGSIGETSALLCIIAFIYLMATKTIKWQIPLTYVGTVFLITLIIGIMNGQGIYYPLFQIFSGGLLFGAVFMATDPVTSPTTKPAMLISSIFMGILTVYLRFNSSYPEGVATSILTMNALTPLLDKIGFKFKFNLKKLFIPLFILGVLIISLILNINNKFNAVVEGDPNFNIISKDVIGTKSTYVVTEKGYGGNIKALVEFNNNKLIKFEILEQNESFYSKVESADFINKLTNNINNLENVDTVSGATVTSTALKKLLINVVEDYKKDGNELQDSNVVVPQDKDFEILEQNVINDTTEYIVLKKSFSGKMKVKVNMQNNIITNFEILEIKDSYQDKVLNTTYISDLITNQDSLDSVDTISGATITSKAIKNIFAELKGIKYE